MGVFRWISTCRYGMVEIMDGGLWVVMIDYLCRLPLGFCGAFEFMCERGPPPGSG